MPGAPRYDTEPHYDYVSLQRSTAAAPDFPLVGGGPDAAWSRHIDATFTYAAGELVNGMDITLSTSGAVARAFLEAKMGVTCNDPDVCDDIAGQTSPLVVKVASNRAPTTPCSRVAFGRGGGITDFENVVPFGRAMRR